MEEFVRRFAEHGYLAVFVLMALESACIPIPSEVTMLFAGFLASPENNVPGAAQLNFVAIALVGTVANLAGSWAAYGAGRAIGRGPLDRYGRYVLIRSHDIDRAEAWWARHGEAAVFFSRMLPVIRTFISLPAGIARMPSGRFTTYTFLGCLPWVFALTAVGYALGENWNTILGQFGLASYVIAGLVVAVAGTFLIRRRLQRRAGERS